jgi:hypothetical protein
MNSVADFIEGVRETGQFIASEMNKEVVTVVVLKVHLKAFLFLANV